jgi:hypothetical protein
MGQHLSGGCLCGAIRYETDADPIVMVNCHCRDCQRVSGSGYAAFMIVPKPAVKVKGEPRFYKTVGDSGGSVDRGFCPTCGAPVITTLERLPDIIGLAAASLDDPSLYKPSLDIFTASAQPWHEMLAATQKKPRALAD